MANVKQFKWPDELINEFVSSRQLKTTDGKIFQGASTLAENVLRKESVSNDGKSAVYRFHKSDGTLGYAVKLVRD